MAEYLDGDEDNDHEDGDENNGQEVGEAEQDKTKNMKHHRVVVGDPSRSLN